MSSAATAAKARPTTPPTTEPAMTFVLFGAGAGAGDPAKVFEGKCEDDPVDTSSVVVEAELVAGIDEAGTVPSQ